MDKITEYLNNRSKELMVYKVPKNEALMEEIFNYDPRTLEATSGESISKYAIGLAQFLIYFASQINKSRVLLMQKRKFMETVVIRGAAWSMACRAVCRGRAIATLVCGSFGTSSACREAG